MTRQVKAIIPKNFESALAELEQVVAAMDAGQMPLEQSLTSYRRGMELLKYCQARLLDAQQQVKILEAGSLNDFNVDGDNSSGNE